MGYLPRNIAIFSFFLFASAFTGCGVRSCTAGEGGTEGRRALQAHTDVLEAQTPALPVLLFFGDSLMAGYQLAAEEAFPAKIESRMRAEGIPFRAVNAGVSGDTTAGGLARLDWSLKLKPAVVFLCLGANDGLRGLPLEDTERNLRELIERIGKAGAQVVLGGMLIPSNYGADYASRFKAIYPKLAEEFSLALVPFVLEGVALQQELTLPDGVHPNPKGTERMADNAWPVIRSVLEKRAGQ